ncbi:adenosylcobinamide-phosphate synthase CbiB [Methylocystis bryophila]|uniref:adenosylcobinamide-phosphate synthase CbiB n=1 Tax=Methylocystis bryophila TaxID=655015 RepID=UPI001FD9A20D|nr:adenosylcobinamide-phosphate synthase CbiB [Methylocystis bryophila]
MALEAGFGYPQVLFEHIGHPAVWLGAAIDALDRALNRGDAGARRALGFLGLALLLLPLTAAGVALQAALHSLPFGVLPLAAVASSLLAQRSLHAHVDAVARALENSLEDGRAAVGMIVGRDVAALDEAGVARAAIESLAENFSDGVVAPAFWMAFLGFPGALAYKAINTADSMIGHRTPRHEAFGFAAAKLDDLVNLPAARLSALLIALSAGRNGGRAFACMARDAKKHASPNAGWPEAAMAGALGLKLGGPRNYAGAAFDGVWLGDGRAAPGPADIDRALKIFRRADAGLWALIAALWALSAL